MSLADELLADLEEMDDGVDRSNEEEMLPMGETSEMEEVKGFFAVPLPKTITLDDICKLKNSERLRNVLEEIERYSAMKREPGDLQVRTLNNIS